MSEVGIMYTFRVGMDDDQTAEALLREIFDVMVAEEFPTGDVITFALYRDPTMPGRWYLFEHLTAAGAQRDPTNIGKWIMLEPSPSRGTVSERLRVPAEKLASLMAERSWRHVLAPVVVHGCGELVPNATVRKPDSATDMGALYKFRVVPEDNGKVEQIMRDLIEQMALIEYPTNDVMTYTLYTDTAEPGLWVMFEHFTLAGAMNHASSQEIIQLGYAQLDTMIAPYERYTLQPVIVKGCGEPLLKGAA